MLHEYSAKTIRVIDGDTIDFNIDLGFRLSTVQRVRLLGVNCPESNQKKTRSAGIAATDATKRWLEKSTGITIVTSKSDSFGRWLADVYRSDDIVSLSCYLLQAGHAVPFKEGSASIAAERFVLQDGLLLPKP